MKDGVTYLHKALTGNPPKTLLVEGANGVMLDIDFGKSTIDDFASTSEEYYVPWDHVEVVYHILGKPCADHRNLRLLVRYSCSNFRNVPVRDKQQ